MAALGARARSRALVAILLAALVIVDTDVGHRWVADRIAAIRTANGLRFTVGRIDGSLYGDARLTDVRVYDLDGLVFAAPQVALDWSPLAVVREPARHRSAGDPDGDACSMRRAPAPTGTQRADPARLRHPHRRG